MTDAKIDQTNEEENKNNNEEPPVGPEDLGAVSDEDEKINEPGIDDRSV